GDAVGLPARLGASRAAHRRPQRIVRVLVLLDQIKLQLRRDHGLPPALGIHFQHIAQHVARRHGHPATVRVEAVVNDLCGGLSRPRHAAHRLRVGLEHDVDLGRTHGLAGLRRVVPRHGLQEHTLRQAHPLLFGELLRGHDLAARDPCHVGNDGLDLGNAVVADELLNLAGHAGGPHLAFARSRLAAPNAANRARENGLSMTFHSGCHCTATAKRRAFGTRNASTTPSGARASTARSDPRRSTPWLCRELTRSRSVPASVRSKPPGSSVTSWAGPYWTSSGCESSSRWSRWPATSCSFW